MIRDLLRDVTPLQLFGYVLAAIATVGIVWMVAVTYLVAFS
jgi:hypothetical protein